MAVYQKEALMFKSLKEELELATSFKHAINIALESFGLSIDASIAIIIADSLTNQKTEAEDFSTTQLWSLADINELYDTYLLSLTKSLKDLLNERGLNNICISIADLITEAPVEKNINLGIQSALALRIQYLDQDFLNLYLFFTEDLTKQAENKQSILAIEKYLQYLGDYLISKFIFSKRINQIQEVLQEDHLQDPYKRLINNSEAVVFTVDKENIIKFLNKNAFELFGIMPESFLGDSNKEWFDIISIKDREAIKNSVLNRQAVIDSFEEEFRIVNYVTGKERWLLAKLIPLIENGTLAGWDGFCIDITPRKAALEALESQSKKVRALYTVSSAIRGYLDPINIATRGLTALCEATTADSGLCFLFTSPRSDELTPVAHYGLSPTIRDKVGSYLKQKDLFNIVAEKGQSVVIADIKNDPRCKFLTLDDSINSALLVPVVAEDEIFGIIAVFHQQLAKFDGGDVMLIGAAANQIGLAARQANLFAAYRKQTKNLTVLYRISHELSHLLPLEEIFMQAFTIIRDELGLKRLWLGLLNENGTRIVGQAAYGPGWKKKLVEIDVEIGDEKNPLAQVINEKKALLVDDPEKLLGPLLIRKFFAHFSIKTLALAPLIVRGKILGVLAVQPSSSDIEFEEEELILLSSLANEIANIVLTKRLESKLTETDKMRSVGLLAAGIAHNFNNILQAIIGQASLLEMSSEGQTNILKSSRIISESATKGAGLVRQLLTFANFDEPQTQIVQVNDIVSEEFKSWSQMLTANQQIKLSLKQELPKVKVDPRHFQRIISALLSNAIEAMRDKGGLIQIFSDSVTSEQELIHFEVPLGNYVRVGVRDRGVGMDDETKKRCFEPFFTTKNIDPTSGLGLTGAGLGLASAYALARKNGGRLVVDSRLGHGSVFTLYLPIQETIKKQVEKDNTKKVASNIASIKGEISLKNESE